MKEPSNAFKYCWAVLGYRKDLLLNWLIDQHSIKDTGEGTQFNLRDGRQVEVSVNYKNDTFSVVIKSETGDVLDSVKTIFLGELVYFTSALIEETACKESIAV